MLEVFWKMAVIFKPVHLCQGESPYDVAPVVLLEIPWCDGNHIIVANPDSSLEFTSDSAASRLAVGALY